MPIYKFNKAFLDSGSSSRLIIAIIDTFLADELLSWLTMLINCKFAPAAINSLSKALEFLAKFPRAAAAFERVFYSLSFSNATNIGIAGFKC